MERVNRIYRDKGENSTSFDDRERYKIIVGFVRFSPKVPIELGWQMPAYVVGNIKKRISF